MNDIPRENGEIVFEKDAGPKQSSRRRQRIRNAVFVSIFVHLVGGIALLCWYFPGAQSQASKNASPTNGPSKNLVPRDNPPAKIPAAPQGDDLPEDEIKETLESQIEAAKQIPDERKLDELEKNLKRLESISNPESAREVAAKISSSLGLDSERYAARKPEEVPEGEIDLSKAQLTDVTRTRTPDGGWSYESTLVDDSGRELKVPVTPAEGEAMYEAFQQMKRFPMAAGIYRSVVMPMIQKILEAKSLAK